jgi:hypothetical protein
MNTPIYRAARWLAWQRSEGHFRFEKAGSNVNRPASRVRNANRYSYSSKSSRPKRKFQPIQILRIALSE